MNELGMTCSYKLISKKIEKKIKNNKVRKKKYPSQHHRRRGCAAARPGQGHAATAQLLKALRDETFTLTSSGAEPPSLEEEGVATARMMATTWPTARSPCQGSTWRSASASSPVLHTSRGHRVGCKPGPDMSFLDLQAGHAQPPAGKYEILLTKSRIPPYFNYI